MFGQVQNLTLTSVVFEFDEKAPFYMVFVYLTLTSVVFEFGGVNLSNSISNIFNFNKCCI